MEKRLDSSLKNLANVAARLAEANCDMNRRIALYELNSRKERTIPIQYGFITIKGDKK